ncbi:bile acid:sodium symporter [Patescibacteria group bacterium]|nr:bile acid:sodium symporter [Patescibacteria group bacterium]
MSFALLRTHLRHWIAENQIVAVLVGLILGLVWPEHFAWLNRFSTPLLMAVFFTSSLRLSLPALLKYAKDWRMLLIANSFMLIVIPLALFVPLQFLSHDWALSFLIAGVMPTGMTIALVAEFFGGTPPLALLITVTTSLLAPFTIPFVFQVAIGQSIPIPVWGMMKSLLISIVLPFIAAAVLQRKAPQLIQKHDGGLRVVSVLLFGLLVTGITADTSGASLPNLGWFDIGVIAIGTIWLGLITRASYDLLPWRTKGERLTVALCLVYLNNTLALFIADRYFRSYGAVSRAVILLLVLNLLLLPIKAAAHSFLKAKRAPSSYAS